MAGKALSAKRWFCGQGFFCNSEKARRNANFLRRSAGDVGERQTFNGGAQEKLSECKLIMAGAQGTSTENKFFTAGYRGRR